MIQVTGDQRFIYNAPVLALSFDSDGTGTLATQREVGKTGFGKLFEVWW